MEPKRTSKWTSLCERIAKLRNGEEHCSRARRRPCCRGSEDTQWSEPCRGLCLGAPLHQGRESEDRDYARGNVAAPNLRTCFDSPRGSHSPSFRLGRSEIGFGTSSRSDANDPLCGPRFQPHALIAIDHCAGTAVNPGARRICKFPGSLNKESCEKEHYGAGRTHHNGMPRPNCCAMAPPAAGAIVAPMISPTRVARPIAVAENCGGTLSAGTSTMISAAIA